jgi:hypothetical protein
VRESEEARLRRKRNAEMKKGAVVKGPKRKRGQGDGDQETNEEESLMLEESLVTEIELA